MKIKPEHYAVLKDAITPLDTSERREAYAAAGHSDMRYRWDLLADSGLRWVGDNVGIHDTSGLNLYAYLDDSHIDTALRKIVNERD